MKVRPVIAPEELFSCQTCKDKPQFKTRDLMKAHLASAHEIDSFKGDKKILMHSDGRGYASTTTLWTIGVVEFVQFVVHPR